MVRQYIYIYITVWNGELLPSSISIRKSKCTSMVWLNTTNYTSIYGIFILDMENRIEAVCVDGVVKKKEVEIMIISVEFSDEEEKFINAYTQKNNISVSDLIRNVVIDKIENEYDLKAYYEAKEEYKKNSETYTHNEVKKMMK